MAKHLQIVSYRDILSDIVSYLSFSLMAVSCHHYLNDNFQAHRKEEYICSLVRIFIRPALSFTYTVCKMCSIFGTEQKASTMPRVGPGHPSSPLYMYFLIFSPFHFSLSFIGFTYFLLLSIACLSTRIVPLRFQAGGRRRRPNLVLVRFLFCTLCYLYSLVKMDCGVLFNLVSFYVFLQCFDTVGWVI